MKVKLTVSCIWNVDNPMDEEIAQNLVKEEPPAVILDYLQDAFGIDRDMSDFKVSANFVEE